MWGYSNTKKNIERKYLLMRKISAEFQPSHSSLMLHFLHKRYYFLSIIFIPMRPNVCVGNKQK